MRVAVFLSVLGLVGYLLWWAVSAGLNALHLFG